MLQVAFQVTELGQVGKVMPCGILQWPFDLGQVGAELVVHHDHLSGLVAALARPPGRAVHAALEQGRCTGQNLARVKGIW
jgi:hypothetical protein